MCPSNNYAIIPSLNIVPIFTHGALCRKRTARARDGDENSF